MKLKWEIPHGMEDRDDIHVLYLYNDAPEAMEEKDLIAAIIRKSKKKWVLAIEGRASKNKIVEAKNFDEAESLLEHHMIDIMQEEIDSRKELVDMVQKMNSLRDLKEGNADDH